MSTYYKVTCRAENVEISYTRDTIERAYYLYKQCKEDGETDIKLEEISDNGIALLRAEGIYKPIPTEKEEPKTEKEQPKEQPTDWFEMVWGVSREEYNGCIDNWNRLTGENIEHV